MDQIVVLVQRDCLDYFVSVIPIILPTIIIIQSFIHYKENKTLQKRIHNREEIQKHHDDIFSVYNTYYEFCDCIFSSGFHEAIRTGNVPIVYNQLYNLYNMRNSVGRRGELAKLLFQKTNAELYECVKKRVGLEIEIIDIYLKYINDNERFLTISNGAWASVQNTLGVNNIMTYDYATLNRYPELMKNIIKLCNDEEMLLITEKIDELHELHKYEKYDVYFEKYLSIEEL